MAAGEYHWRPNNRVAPGAVVPFDSQNIQLGLLGASTGDVLKRTLCGLTMRFTATSTTDAGFDSGWESYTQVMAKWFIWESPTMPTTAQVNPIGTGTIYVDPIAQAELQLTLVNYDPRRIGATARMDVPGGLIDVKSQRTLTINSRLCLSMGFVDNGGYIGTIKPDAAYTWGYTAYSSSLVLDKTP